MGAPVAWLEITSSKPDRLLDFYGNLFGWRVADASNEGYTVVDTGAGDEAIGGGIGTAEAGAVGGVTVYVQVDDLQECLDAAASLGGSTVVPPTDLPGGYGRFAMLADPDGHTIGLMANA